MNNYDFKIEKAEYTDFKDIFLLLEQLWTDLPLNYEELNKIYCRAIDSDIQRLIVGKIRGKIIGFCSLTIKNNLWQSQQISLFLFSF
jgi:hypothetical protein